MPRLVVENPKYHPFDPGAADVVLTMEKVPEPASLGLLGVAAFGLLARRRRKMTKGHNGVQCRHRGKSTPHGNSDQGGLADQSSSLEPVAGGAPWRNPRWTTA